MTRLVSGYIRVRAGGDKYGHVLAWEAVNGPKPVGYEIHHLNGNKTDNRLDNLLLVDPTTHRRIHSGCEIRDGEWWKPCRFCGQTKQIATDWYLTRDGYPRYGRCKTCHGRRVNERKRQRAAVK